MSFVTLKDYEGLNGFGAQQSESDMENLQKALSQLPKSTYRWWQRSPR